MRLLVTVLAVLVAASALTSRARAQEDPNTFYAIGAIMASQLVPLELSEAERNRVIQGFRDAASGSDLAVDPESYLPQIQALSQARRQRAAAAEAVHAKQFVDAAAAVDGAVRTESGLIYLEKQAGSGATPTPADRVRVHYHGTLRDGTVFDSSVERGTPAEFPLTRVIPCWTEALQRMKTGGKSRVVCPPEIAYGAEGRPPKIPGGAALAFEVELIEVLPQAAN